MSKLQENKSNPKMGTIARTTPEVTKVVTDTLGNRFINYIKRSADSMVKEIYPAFARDAVNRLPDRTRYAITGTHAVVAEGMGKVGALGGCVVVGFLATEGLRYTNVPTIAKIPIVGVVSLAGGFTLGTVSILTGVFLPAILPLGATFCAVDSCVG